MTESLFGAALPSADRLHGDCYCCCCYRYISDDNITDEALVISKEMTVMMS